MSREAISVNGKFFLSGDAWMFG